MSTIEATQPGLICQQHVQWDHIEHGRMLRCLVYVVSEQSGGYSAFAADLPGASSQGESVTEVTENVADAIKGVIACFVDDKDEIPWEDAGIETNVDTIEKWVVVNV